MKNESLPSEHEDPVPGPAHRTHQSVLLNACKAAGRRFTYHIFLFIVKPRRYEIPGGRITFRLD